MANPEKSSTSAVAEVAVARPAARGRGHGRATLATVAAQACVASMTVSRYLRAPDQVGRETGDRIASALASTGYTPNKHAGMLASGRSSLVAAIIPSIASPLFAETVQGLSDSLRGHGLELLLASTNYSLEREEEQIRAVLGWSPSALVVTGRRHSDAALAMMRQAVTVGLPVLEMWDHDAVDRMFVQVGFSHRQVGDMMARHLLAKGYRDLAYVQTGVPEDFRAAERGEAFAARVRKAGAAARMFHAPRIEPLAAGRHALREMLAAGLPRAVAFANDNLAAGACLQALEQKISVPGEIALLGFGDFPLSRQIAGGISTVGVGPYDIGVACARQLLRMVTQGGLIGPARGRSSLRLPQLLPRATT